MRASSSAIKTRRAAAASVSVVGPAMTDIVSELRRPANSGAVRTGDPADPLWWEAAHASRALVSQLAEETDSKPVQCGFESHRGHPKVQLKDCFTSIDC